MSHYSASQHAMKRSVISFVLLMLLVSTGGCDSAGDSDSSSLEEARARWASSGPSTYRFDYARVCYCSPSNLSATVYVRQDTVWKFENLRGERNELIDAEEYFITPQSFPTVDKLFERIEGAVSNGRVGNLEYDSGLGYPTVADVGASEGVADSGISYRLSDLAATD